MCRAFLANTRRKHDFVLGVVLDTVCFQVEQVIGGITRIVDAHLVPIDVRCDELNSFAIRPSQPLCSIVPG